MPTPPQMMESALRHIASEAGAQRNTVTLDHTTAKSSVPGIETIADLKFILQELINRKLVERAGRMDMTQYRLTMAGYERLTEMGANAAQPAAGPNTADLDPLTGLWNRRVLDRDLSEAVAVASADAPLSFVMVDVDHFKKVNDTHGHPAGDAALKEIAARLRSVGGGKGRAYRYGGEEMALLLKNHSPEEALSVAERARLAIEKASIPGHAFTVTASLGIATHPEHAHDAAALLKAADAAMYQAKHLGRNLVRLYGESDTAPEAVPVTKTPKRRMPVPGGLSDDEAERIRDDYFRTHQARCPKDQAILTVSQAGFGQVGGLVIYCPRCGLTADIEGATG